MVLVEAFQLVVQRVAFLVAFRYEHCESVRQVVASAGEELQHIVERCAVAHSALYYGAHAFGDTAQIVSPQQGFPCLDPQSVASYGIDFSVVPEHTERLGETPGGEGVGRKAGVYQGYGAGEVAVVQVVEILPQLL